MNQSFAEKVYAVVEKIPKGRVSTYKYVALAIDSKGYRAVGTALKNNPRAPQVPCHRVIKSDCSIGGFSGKMSGPKIQKKIRLLREEGVPVVDGKIPPELVWTFS